MMQTCFFLKQFEHFNTTVKHVDLYVVYSVKIRRVRAEYANSEVHVVQIKTKGMSGHQFYDFRTQNSGTNCTCKNLTITLRPQVEIVALRRQPKSR